MDASAIRALVALVLVGLLLQQALRAPARSRNRSSCLLGAGGFAMVVLLNGLAALGVDVQPLALPFTLGASALLVGSLLMLVLAYRNGEMSRQFTQARRTIAEERERREQ